MTPRQQRREQNLASMVDEALRLVTAEGFDALTMPRLASELGYAVGALYRYFDSKDALVVAVQRRVLEQLAADLARTEARVAAHVAASPGLAPEAAALLSIVASARTYRGLAERRPAHFALMSRWLGDPAPMVDDAAAGPAMPAVLALFAPVVERFVRAEAAGALRCQDPMRAALILWASVHGVLQLRKLGRFGLPSLEPGPLGDELIAALLRGFGADPDHLAQALGLATRGSFEQEN
ncbi:MAG: TetR/AcrR family transcriptional regulator [Sandaracinaceae bacterium]|nr:TetR/AcrR family transcriptional regulator [Sandaracinaceae bacterium]